MIGWLKTAALIGARLENFSNLVTTHIRMSKESEDAAKLSSQRLVVFKSETAWVLIQSWTSFWL